MARDIDPVQTAAAIARVRAAEAELAAEERLFEDPYAQYFDEGETDVQAVFEAIPFFREQIRLRTRYLDDCVRSAIESGTRQLVLLGAGFDMRALRMPEIPSKGVRVIEVDHLQQLDRKQERLARMGVAPPEFVRYAAADLMDPVSELEVALQGAGLDREGSVLWLAEGLIGYLSAEAVGRMGGATADWCGPGSLLVGNYFSGAFSFERLDGLLSPAGWRVSQGPSFAELHRKYLGPDVPPGSSAFGFVRAEK